MTLLVIHFTVYSTFNACYKLSEWSNLPKLDILACVGLIRFFNMSELKVKGLWLSYFTRSGKIFHQGHKLMMVSSVVIQLWKRKVQYLLMIIINVNSVELIIYAFILKWAGQLRQMSWNSICNSSKPRKAAGSGDVCVLCVCMCMCVLHCHSIMHLNSQQKSSNCVCQW